MNSEDDLQPRCEAPVLVEKTDLLAGRIPIGSELKINGLSCQFCKLSKFFTLYLDFCSHYRAVEFFVESIIANPDKKAFRAAQCESAQAISSGQTCSSLSMTSVNYMGLYASKKPDGRFFLKTNAAAPYATE